MKYLPNALSASRAVLAPYIFYLLWTGHYVLALVWFAIAAFTDVADGYLARLLKVSSRAGAYLDPIADKILLSGSFLTLTLAGLIPMWLAVLVLGRDVLILLFAGGALLFTKTRRDFPPSIWGKLSTFAQICYVLMLVGGAAQIVPMSISDALAWAALALLIISSADYARQMVRKPH